MRKNNVITFDFDKEDLEILLGSISMTIQKMEWTQEALKGASDIIRAALQEDEADDEPDCENCILPCRNNPNIIRPEEAGLDEEGVAEEIPDGEDEDEAESLAIDLLKAVFAVLSDEIDNA